VRFPSSAPMMRCGRPAAAEVLECPTYPALGATRSLQPALLGQSVLVQGASRWPSDISGLDVSQEAIRLVERVSARLA
jgi:hypothetical protein